MTGYRPGWFTDHDDEVYQARLAERQRRMAASTAAASARVTDQVDQLRAERAPSRMGARTIGVLTAITVGMEIWAHSDPAFDLPDRGGIVVAVDPGGPDTVDENGEIRRHPARYRCYDPRGDWPLQAFQWISEDDIDRARVSVVDGWQLSNAARRFALEIAGVMGRKHAKQGMLNSFEAQLYADGNRLAAIVMGGH